MILSAIMFAVFVAVVLADNALASGPPWTYIIHLEQIEYDPGDTVTIRVEGVDNGLPSNRTAVLVIADGMEDLMGKNVLYKESKQLVNGWAEFTYTIPAQSLPFSNSLYRYLVLVYEPGGAVAYDKAFFFSRENASRIVISDLKIFNEKVKLGESLDFEFKVTDGTGNPIPHVRILAQIPYQSCEGEDRLRADLSPYFMSESNRRQYVSNGVIRGSIVIPRDFEPRTYQMIVQAAGESSIGFKPAEERIEIEVLDSERIITSVFDTISFDNGGTDIDARLGGVIHIIGRTVLNQCASILPNITLKAELVEWHPSENRPLKTVETREIVSGTDGAFDVSFNLANLNPSEYRIFVTAEYQDFKETRQLQMRLHDVKEYVVNEEGKELVVSVDGWYSNPKNLQFDKLDKKLIIDVDTSDVLKRVDIAIPHILLDGDFTVLMNGNKHDLRTGTLYKNATHSNFILYSKTDNTSIEIIGTTVIPEFPPVLFVLGATFATLIMIRKFLTR